MGELASCTDKNCISKCIFGNTPACQECVKEHCYGPFETCSGLDNQKLNTNY